MTGAEVAAAIGSVATTTKSIAEAIQAIRKKAIDPETKKALADTQDSLIDLRSRVLDLQGKALQLQEENSQLREQIRQNESRASEREDYERRKVGQAWVMTPRGQSEPMFCLTCFEKRQLNALQALPRDSRMHFGSHWCPTCRVPVGLK